MHSSYALMFLAMAGLAQDEPKPSEAASTALHTSLHRFAEHIRSLASYRVDADGSWKASGGGPGEPETGKSRHELLVSRPGKFAIRVWPQGDDSPPALEVAAEGNGDEVVGLLRQPDRTLVTRVRRTDPVEGLRRNPVLAQSLSPSFLDVVIRPDLADHICASLSGVADLGAEDLNGSAARHFRGRWGDGRTLDLWLAEGDHPLLKRVRWTKAIPPSSPDLPPFELVSTIDFRWETDAQIDPANLSIRVPDDAQPVDDLYAAVTGAGDTLKVGQPAPELNLDLLGGGKLRLADHKGLDHVVLNFWATWYPTGVDSLPTVAEFAREFGPKGVVFYHVNMAEDPALISAFLKERGLALTVAIDPDGSAMETYAVRALPFSVVIRRDGTIADVNAGDLRGFRERFRSQLEALGRDAPPAAAPPR